jgi:hypothetical protein
MSTPEIGSYVTHDKLPELGSGEITASDNGAVRIRFASGDRNFVWDMVRGHLSITMEAPAPPAKAARKPRKKAAEKATEKAAEK